MYKHHEESIKIMTKHYRENAEIKALFLIGSVATGMERPDSDLDGVAVVSQEYFKYKEANGGSLEVCTGKCTYQGGYFDIHYLTREKMEEIVTNGSEPMRNMFSCAKTLFCDEPGLPELVASITKFPKIEAEKRQFRFYCTFKMYYSYFWVACKPEGFYRSYVANGMIFNLYRLILIENEILFPSVRRLEDYVKLAPNKPENIIEKCHRFMKSLSDEDCKELVNSYESWTSYNYPKDHNIVMNNFADPNEWQ